MTKQMQTFLIVQKATESAPSMDTVLIGDDTDLFASI